MWRYQDPYFDIVGWVLRLAGLSPGERVLDAGCGNGEYLRALAQIPVRAAIDRDGAFVTYGDLAAFVCR